MYAVASFDDTRRQAIRCMFAYVWGKTNKQKKNSTFFFQRKKCIIIKQDESRNRTESPTEMQEKRNGGKENDVK